MNLTTYFKNHIFNYFFGQTAYVLPNNYYGGLLTNSTFEDGDTPVEPVGDGYARVAIPNNKTTFSTATTGTLDNDIEINFPSALGADWPTTPFFALFDASTNGNLLMWSDVNALTGDSITVADGTFPKIKAGSLTIS
jgi:hypothetical protein